MLYNMNLGLCNNGFNMRILYRVEFSVDCVSLKEATAFLVLKSIPTFTWSIWGRTKNKFRTVILRTFRSWELQNTRGGFHRYINFLTVFKKFNTGNTDYHHLTDPEPGISTCNFHNLLASTSKSSRRVSASVNFLVAESSPEISKSGTIHAPQPVPSTSSPHSLLNYDLS